MAKSDFPEIPGYEIKSELGSGGMAVVYLAVQKSLDRKVAIKVLRTTHDDDPEKTERRFLREGRTLAKITHRNVCGIYDIARIGDIAYIAMEYLDGGTLVDNLKAGMSVGEAVAVTVQVASALAEAHAQGIIHRDLKPSNVMMRGGRVPVLTDFGIARELTATQTKITAENMIVGTPAYMSPEQVTGGEVDGSSDVYSLGIMLFELLTGQVPYRGDSPIAVCMQHLTAPLPKLPPQLAELQPILDRMLAKKREERFGSMQEFTLALRNAFIASNTLRSVMQFAPDQPWSEQLRNLGFTFDTLRDSDIRQAMEAQKQQARAARLALENDINGPAQRSQQLPQPPPPPPARPRWLVPVLVVLLLALAGGIGSWLFLRGPSATDELALRALKSDFERFLVEGKLYGDGRDNAAGVLDQMRDIASRSATTKAAETNLWLRTEKAARDAVASGRTDGIQTLINQAGATFDSARVEKLAGELNATLQAAADQERISSAVKALDQALAAGGEDIGAALEAVRTLLPAGNPQRQEAEARVETRLAGMVGMAQQNGDLPGAQLKVGQWQALFPDSKLAADSRKAIDALLAKRGLKDSIAAAGRLLDQTPFGVSTVNAVAAELKRLRASPGAAAEAAALQRIETGLLQRIEAAVAASAESNPAQAEQLLESALADLPASATLERMRQQLERAKQAVAAREAEAKAAALRGTLAIDALPWARLVSVKRSDGQPAALPPNPVTPLVLTLPEGSYQLELADGAGNKRTQTALVGRQQRSQVKVDFRSVTTQAYLDEAGF